MKTRQSLIFILLLISLGVTACRPIFVPHIRARFSLDKPFPDRDIVFITEWVYTTGDKILGFIQSDGSGLEYVSLKNMSSDDKFSLTPPTWSSDGKSIFSSTYGYSLPFVIHSDGIQYSLSDNIRAIGSDINYVSVIPGTQQALYAGFHEDIKTNMVAILELDKDPVVLVSYPPPDASANNNWVYLTLGPNPICGKDRVLFLYSNPVHPEEGRKLVFLNIEDETQTSLSSKELGTEWFTFPSCSPDGKWVAYTASDGIYLIRPDGTQKQLLVSILPFDEFDRSDSFPAVSWSPDGEWIVYHHCKSGASCNMSDESAVAVYKMNIETGQKIKLVDGGLFPYWRWRDKDD